jgi:tetratricopeptide (TPR) repeat protein
MDSRKFQSRWFPAVSPSRLKKSVAVLTAGAGMVTLLSRGASAADVCIGEKAKEALQSCGGTGPKEFKGDAKSPQVNFRGVSPGEKPKGDNKPKNPNLEMSAAARDDRTNRLQARQKALLLQEIQQVEALFKATGRNAKDRAQILRRLAEAYVELESSAFREKTQAEIDRDAMKKSNPSGASQKQAAVEQNDKILKQARSKAVAYYTQLTTDYPDYPNMDEVLYYMAYEYEQANDLNNARKVYLRITQEHPKSKYVPNAYLAFGELFFNEAQGDPSKWDYARDAYKKVTGYKPEDGNKVYGYAWYKLAYVHWNKGEFDDAIEAFKKTIRYGMDYSKMPNAAKLAEAARRDIVPVYAQKGGNPRAAFNVFQPLSGDASGQTEKTIKMLNDLGQNYLDTGHYADAIEMYKDLKQRDPGDKLCVYQAHITEATMALKGGNQKDAIKAELEQQVKSYGEFKKSGRKAEAIQACASTTAALVTETAMAWHIEAVGSNNQRGTGDTKTMALAAQLYQKVVDSFDSKEFATFEFPRLVKEDWPSIFKIKYNMADLLYFQNDWAKCGPAFDSVVAENPTGPDAAEAAYAAVLCYQKTYDATHTKDQARKGSGNLPTESKKQSDDQKRKEEAERLKPKDLSESQKGMVQAFNRYVCYIKPTTKEGQDKLIEVKYARARTYFEAQHWEEAALAFRELALNHADAEQGVWASQLYLESANVLGAATSPPRPSCFDDIATDVPKFLELYCQGEKEKKNATECTTLNKVQVNIIRLKAEKLVELAGTQQGTQALDNFEKGASSYSEMFRKYCSEPVDNGQQPQADRCDEIAYNAARAYQAARLIAKAIVARNSLIKFDEKTKGNSPLAKKAIYEIGGNYQAIAVYDRAADQFEKYAQSSDPPPEKADLALSDAVLLRLGLGQDSEAIKDAELFKKKFGASKPAQTAAIAFAIGAHYAEKEEWDKARSTLSASMGVIEKAAPDIQVQAHATLGRAYAKMKGGDRNAKQEYAKVRGIWSNPDEAISRMKSAYPDEDDSQRTRRIGKALTAVGEAYFMEAEEQKTREVDSLKFPVYNGSGTKEDVLKHITSKVVPWYEKKGKAIEKVEADYKKIVDLKPDAPPRWVIAAGSRVGLMWGNFVDEFRAAPIPKAWKNDDELRGIYYARLDEASEPIKSKRAKPALQTCLAYSVKFQYFDDYSRNCEVWLGKNYKAEYHVVDELRGSPTLSNSGLDEKNPPLLIGGSFWRAQQAQPEKPAAPAAGKEEDPKGKPAGKKPAGGGAKRR